ncbi:MAG: post-PEP-CTERM-1 domain-containing protein [Stenotrophomonas sp.]
MALYAHAQGQAAEPQRTSPPVVGSESGVSVGIDAKTGRLRPLTDAEILQLSQAAERTMPAARPGATDLFSKMPRTEIDARATMHVDRKGMLTMQLPLSSLSSTTATQEADGSVRISEDEAMSAPAAQEVLK